MITLGRVNGRISDRAKIWTPNFQLQYLLQLYAKNTICWDIPLTLARACLIFTFALLVPHSDVTIFWWWVMNLLSENSCNRQNSVYLGYPQHCEQTAYGINHTKFSCVCKHLWSLSFSKLPHSLRLCGILKKPLDHKCLHISIVQYYLTSQLWVLEQFSGTLWMG